MDRFFVFCIAVDGDGAGCFAEQSSNHLKIRQETANGNRAEERGKREQGEEGHGEERRQYYAARWAVVSIHQQPKPLSSLW